METNANYWKTQFKPVFSTILTDNLAEELESF